LVLAEIQQRRRLESRAREVDGAADLISDLAEGLPVTWITVPDVAAILDAAAIQASAAGVEPKRDTNLEQLKALRPRLPKAGESYNLQDFAARFDALCASLELSTEICLWDEAESLFQVGAQFVLHQDVDPAQPTLMLLAGDLLWSAGNGFARNDLQVLSLKRYLRAGELLASAGHDSAQVRDVLLALIERCLTLVDSRVSPLQDVIRLATEAVSLVGRAHIDEPAVVRARFSVARASRDRAALAILAEPGSRARLALPPGELRIAEACAYLADAEAWRHRFGPFAAPIYSLCHETTILDAFTLFGVIGPEEDLPETRRGHHCVQVARTTVAESGCHEVSAAIAGWTLRAAEAGVEVFVGGEPCPIRRAVPTAAMHALAPFSRCSPEDVPETVSFLFGLGRAAAADPSLADQIDAMLAFLEDRAEDDASPICAAILTGVVLHAVGSRKLTCYIGHLELGADHLSALGSARRLTPLQAR